MTRRAKETDPIRTRRDWRERWQPFAIGLALMITLSVVAGLLILAYELMRLQYSHI